MQNTNEVSSKKIIFDQEPDEKHLALLVTKDIHTKAVINIFLKIMTR